MWIVLLIIIGYVNRVNEAIIVHTEPLFGSHLCFKSLCKKTYKIPLKMQNKDISLSHMSFGFSTTLFRCVSAPLDIKIKANPDKVDWLFLSYGLFIFPSTPYRRCK